MLSKGVPSTSLTVFIDQEQPGGGRMKSGIRGLRKVALKTVKGKGSSASPVVKVIGSGVRQTWVSFSILLLLAV